MEQTSSLSFLRVTKDQYLLADNNKGVSAWQNSSNIDHLKD